MAMPAWQEEKGALLRENRNQVETSPLTALLDLICITLNLDYFLQHKEEFDELPEDLIQHMLSLPSCKLRSPEYFSLVVKAGRRSIKIPCYPLPHEEFTWTTEHINSILDLIKKTCPPGSLEKFGLCKPYHPAFVKDCTSHFYGQIDAETSHPEPDLERVHAILREQPGLKEIDLSMPYLDVTRETLSIIGETCHDLRSLSINGYSEEPIDLDVMRQLAKDCPLLQKLEFGCCTIKQESVLHALHYLKYLVHFETTINDIVAFTQSGGILPPSLKTYNINFEDEDDFKNRFIIQTMCPNVSSLEFNPQGYDLDLSQFKFKSVDNFSIMDVQSHNIPQIGPFLQMCGSDMVEVQLTGLPNVTKSSSVTIDLSVLTEHCPKLEHIYIANLSISRTCEYAVTQEKVRFVRCLTLENIPEPAYIPPDQFLYPIMCNGVLEHLTVPAVSPRLLTRLTREMRVAAVDSKPSPVFPKLLHLNIRKVGYGDVTLRQAVDLVSLAPCVTEVYFHSLAENDQDDLEDFLGEFSPNACLY